MPALPFCRRTADVLPLVLAAAIPLVYLHVMYQPQLSLGPATVDGSDIAILLIVIAAAVSGLLFGWGPVLGPRLLWANAAGLIALFAASCFWLPLEAPVTHLVTAAKYAEYALLAPAAVLLFRRSVDITRFFAVFIGWCMAASLWGALQFLGLVNEFDGKRPGQREVSFLGHEDFGAFAGAALLIGFAALALRVHRRLGSVALVAGTLGVILDASISAYLGVVLAVLAVVWVGRRAGTLGTRRILAMAAIVVTIGAGVNVLRGSDVSNYLSFLGIHTSAVPTTGVQTGSQRVLLLYIGLHIWESHPWLGVGFERSGNRYQPYLVAAKKKFPSDPPLAFPSKAHPWGIQNLWLQLLADTGIVGFALGVALFANGLLTAIRSLRGSRFVALVAAAWILIAAGTWNAIGIVAGIPLDATTWLAFGLAVAAADLERKPLAARTTSRT